MECTNRQVWEKLGRVYCAAGEADWRASHAYIPTAVVVDEERIRVFVAFLDSQGLGRIGFVDVESEDPRRVISVSDRPALDLGTAGTFDEHGVSPLSLIHYESAYYLFYAGWQRSATVRYFLFTGLARSVDGGVTFQRVSAAPILDRCDGELLVRTGGFVFRHDGRWLFAYMGGSQRVEIQGKATPTYDMMTMESATPLVWPKHGRTALVPDRPREFGFGRPWVLCEAGRCRMWLSVRAVDSGYGLTYAESADGTNWVRFDDALEFVGVDEGWDSNTKSFASVVDTKFGRYMFYNGNGYGASGFGVARLISDGNPRMC